MEKQTVTIKEAAQQLGVGLHVIYRAVKNGQIHTIRIGNRLLVPKAVMQRLLADPGPQEPTTDVAMGVQAVEVASG